MDGIDVGRRTNWLGGVLLWFEGIAGDVIKRVSEFAGLELGLCQVKTVQL